MAIIEDGKVAKCLKCGSQGYTELLIFCSQCKISVEHRYCLDVMPKDPLVEASFLCQECRCNPQAAILALKEFSRDSDKENDDHSRKCNFQFTDSISEQRKSEVHSSSKIHNQVLCEANSGSDRESESDSTLRKQRRLILNDEEDEVVEEARCHNAATDESVKITQFSSNQTIPKEKPSKDQAQTNFSQVNSEALRMPARPFVDHAWRGNFDIGNEQYGPVVAHLSTRACARVYDGIKLLTPVLHMEKLPRLMAWPNSFKTKPPTDDNLALYFFPSDPWSEAMIDQLLDDLIGGDLMLKITFDKAELLVYSSLLLPEHFHRFDGKYFLWGVFRGRQVSLLSIPTCSSDKYGSAQERPKTEGCHSSHDSGESYKRSSSCTCNSPHSREIVSDVPAISVRNQRIVKELPRIDRLKHPKEVNNRKLHYKRPGKSGENHKTSKWFRKEKALDSRSHMNTREMLHKSKSCRFRTKDVHVTRNWRSYSEDIDL